MDPIERVEALDWPELPRGPVVTTGAGLSAHAARWCAERLRARGQPARFVPLGAFAVGEAPPEDRVIFSFGLSANARIAARARHRRTTWILTAASEADVEALAPGSVRVPLPPADGPGPWATTLLQAAGVARWVGEPIPSPSLETPTPTGGPPDLVVHGPSLAEPARWLAWCLMEHLRVPAPLAVEVLDLAHGPVQALSLGYPRVWLLPEPGTEPLFTRARTVLGSTRARLVDFGGPRGRWGSWIRALVTGSRLAAGPAPRVDDGPLYGLERPVGGAARP